MVSLTLFHHGFIYFSATLINFLPLMKHGMDIYFHDPHKCQKTFLLPFICSDDFLTVFNIYVYIGLCNCICILSIIIFSLHSAVAIVVICTSFNVNFLDWREIFAHIIYILASFPPLKYLGQTKDVHCRCRNRLLWCVCMLSLNRSNRERSWRPSKRWSQDPIWNSHTGHHISCDDIHLLLLCSSNDDGEWCFISWKKYNHYIGAMPSLHRMLNHRQLSNHNFRSSVALIKFPNYLIIIISLISLRTNHSSLKISANEKPIANVERITFQRRHSY
jgi:hypothetical protein